MRLTWGSVGSALGRHRHTPAFPSASRSPPASPTCGSPLSSSSTFLGCREPCTMGGSQEWCRYRRPRAIPRATWSLGQSGSLCGTREEEREGQRRWKEEHTMKTAQAQRGML